MNIKTFLLKIKKLDESGQVHDADKIFNHYAQSMKRKINSQTANFALTPSILIGAEQIGVEKIYNDYLKVVDHLIQSDWAKNMTNNELILSNVMGLNPINIAGANANPNSDPIVDDFMETTLKQTIFSKDQEKIINDAKNLNDVKERIAYVMALLVFKYAKLDSSFNPYNNPDNKDNSDENKNLLYLLQKTMLQKLKLLYPNVSDMLVGLTDYVPYSIMNEYRNFSSVSKSKSADLLAFWNDAGGLDPSSFKMLNNRPLNTTESIILSCSSQNLKASQILKSSDDLPSLLNQNFVLKMKQYLSGDNNSYVVSAVAGDKKTKIIDYLGANITILRDTLQSLLQETDPNVQNWNNGSRLYFVLAKNNSSWICNPMCFVSYIVNTTGNITDNVLDKFIQDCK